MEKPWGGRFEKETDEMVERFSESVSFDRRLYRQDIRASLAHAEMLCRAGLLSDEELVKIHGGLDEIQAQIEAGEFEFLVPLEDVHMNIESALVQRIGEAGRKLHTGRSRNDQVACDLRMWCRDAVEESLELIRDCQRALLEVAAENVELIVPGFTHLQHAQPVLLAHLLLAYVEMLERDAGRLAECRARMNVSPLGACALAGTALPIDPDYTAAELGFDGRFRNSADAVSDRDFAAELVFDLGLIAVHLSRLAEEWLLWTTPEFDFLDLGEDFCTGSSIMPQKKNADVLELVRGKCGRVLGDLASLLTMLKGLPLAYNRDLQEDKEAVFNAVDTVQGSLSIMAALIRTAAFKPDSIARACALGHMDATALADYLVGRGLAFREAHQIAGRAVRKAAAAAVALSELGLDELREFSELIAEDVYRVLGARNCVENYRSPGSSAPAEVRRQLDRWRERLGG